MLLFAFSENAFSQIYDYRAYKAWAAYVVTGQNAQPIVRMATSYNTGLTLVLDFFPDNTYFMALSEPTNSFLPSSNLYVEIRIDTNNILQCQGVGNTSNGFIWLTIVLPRNNNFLQQAMSGSILRFKINQQDSTYFRFSLAGFTAAYNYAMELCRRVYHNYNNDEKYFRDTPNENKPDETFFYENI